MAHRSPWKAAAFLAVILGTAGAGGDARPAAASGDRSATRDLVCGDEPRPAEAHAAQRLAADPGLYWRRSRFGVQGRGAWVRFVPSAVA